MLTFRIADMDGPSAPFARQHWRDVTDEYELTPELAASIKCVARCDAFDPVTRACTAYEDRPPICSGYPWYGKAPNRSKLLNPACSYHADVRTMLPLVEVTHGR